MENKEMEIQAPKDTWEVKEREYFFLR